MYRGKSGVFLLFTLASMLLFIPSFAEAAITSACPNNPEYDYHCGCVDIYGCEYYSSSDSQGGCQDPLNRVHDPERYDCSEGTVCRETTDGKGYCVSPTESNCQNGQDDDLDGSVDCADTDCDNKQCADGMICTGNSCIEDPLQDPTTPTSGVYGDLSRQVRDNNMPDNSGLWDKYSGKPGDIGYSTQDRTCAQVDEEGLCLVWNACPANCIPNDDAGEAQRSCSCFSTTHGTSGPLDPSQRRFFRYDSLDDNHLWQYLMYVVFVQDELPISWSADDGVSLWIYDKDGPVSVTTRPNAESGTRHPVINLDPGYYQFVWYVYNGPSDGNVDVLTGIDPGEPINHYFKVIDSSGYLPDVGNYGQDICEAVGGSWAGTYFDTSTESNPCCGDNLDDHGYIATDPAWMCLEKDGFWDWHDASVPPFFELYEVTPFAEVVGGQPQYDAISNVREWYYCDALGTQEISAADNAVQNHATFPSSIREGYQLCPAIPPDYSLIFLEDTPEASCAEDYPNKDCCEISGFELPDDIPLTEAYADTIASYCAQCYDQSGADIGKYWLDSGEGDGGGESTQPKNDVRDLGTENQKPGDTSLTCTENEGVLCTPDEVCAGGYQIASSDSGLCCYAEGLNGCMGKAIAETLLCADMGGLLIPDPASNPGISCTDAVQSSDADQDSICCVGDYEWTATQAGVQSDENQAFVCYIGNPVSTADGVSGDSLFGECCAVNDCSNTELVQQTGSSAGFMTPERVDDGHIFSSGSMLHTIKSWDQVGINTLYDHVLNLSFAPGEGESPLFRPAQLDWRAYDHISLDFYIDGLLAPKEIVLKDGQEIVGTIPFSGNTVRDALTPYTWHHLIAALPSGKERVTSVAIVYDNQESRLVSGYFDNAVLHSSRPELPSKYCSGNFRTWIDDLNPPEGTDFTTLDEYGPYWFACDDTLSFQWTGHACCGSQTLPGAVESASEYYEDDLAGCWGGVPVEHGQSVADALRTTEGEDVFFFDGEFHSCGESITRTGLSVPAVTTPVQTVPHGSFEVLGDYYCDVEGIWKPIDDSILTRIIAAKLYNYTAEESLDEYVLSCGSPEDIANNVVDELESDYTGEFCVLTYQDGGQKTIVGTSVSNIRSFLEHLKIYAPFLKNQQYSDALDVAMCDAAVPQPGELFAPCDPYGIPQTFTIYYAPQFRLVLFTQSGDTFLADRSFLEEMLDAILEFFTSIFGGQWAETGQIPIPPERAEFNRLYIASADDLQMIAVEEFRPKSGLPLARDTYIEYRNFHDPDLPEKVSNIIGNEVEEKHSLFGDQRFAFLMKNTYDGDDVWKRITNIVRLQDTLSGAYVTDTCGNGVAGLDEACDAPDFKSRTCDAYPGKQGDASLLTCTDDCQAIDQSNCEERVFDCSDADGDGYFVGTECDQDPRYVGQECAVNIFSYTTKLKGSCKMTLPAEDAACTVYQDPVGTVNGDTCECSCDPHAVQDCDDNNLDVNPGMAEVCDDGVDNDCDGADEACATTCGITDVFCGGAAPPCCDGYACTLQDSGNWRCEAEQEPYACPNQDYYLGPYTPPNTPRCRFLPGTDAGCGTNEEPAYTYADCSCMCQLI